MSSIRPMVFNTDPKKIPEVVDVFREDLLKKRNQLLGDDPIKKAATEYLKNEGIEPEKLLADLTKRADGYLDQAADEFDSIRGRLEDAFDVPAFDRLVNDLEKSELVQAVKDFDGLEKVKVVMGEVETFVDETIDAVNVKPMLDMVNSVIGKTTDQLFSFVDVVGQSALVKGLTASLMAWRVPELVELLIETVEDEDAKEELWQENAIRSSNQGDLTQAERYVSRMSATRTRLVENELIRGLLSSYKKDVNITFKEAGVKLMAFCNGINAKWDILPNGNRDVAPYLGISDDAVKALSFTDRWAMAYMGQHQSVESFEKLMNRIFPQFNKDF